MIELSGFKIKDCLKDNKKYEIDFSDSLFNQEAKAFDFYKDSIKSDVISLLEKGLKTQKDHTKTKLGNVILDEHLRYLNSKQGKIEILHRIAYDRVSALPLERFKNKYTYLEIYTTAINFIVERIPCLRLLIKSYKKLPLSIHPERETERKKIIYMIEQADIKQNHDLIDTELIQIAILGFGNYPIHIYTMDSAYKIKIRLHIAHLLIKIMVTEAKNILRDLNINFKNLNTINNIDKINNSKIFGINDTNETRKNNLKLLQKVAAIEFRFGKISIIKNPYRVKENIHVKKLCSTPLKIHCKK